MFGINSVEQVGQIIEGHVNEIIDAERALYTTRMNICHKCPLQEYTPIGYVCSSKKCFNTKTEEVVDYPGEYNICGCGCRLEAKTRVKGAKCVLNKW